VFVLETGGGFRLARMLRQGESCPSSGIFLEIPMMKIGLVTGNGNFPVSFRMESAKERE